MTPNNLVSHFIEKLNQTYTERGVNGVARAEQSDIQKWHVICEFDSHMEYYVIGIASGGWKFIRVFAEGI